MERPQPNVQIRVREVLRDHGLRYSRPREVILGYLLEEDRHVSAEGLYLQLKQRGTDLSLSTVYLNLSVLAEAGLLREFKGANGQSLYDSNVSPHYHVVCRETGEILDVPTPMIDGKPLARYLKESIEAATGWIVDEPRLSLSGVSPRARQTASRPEDDRATDVAASAPNDAPAEADAHGPAGASGGAGAPARGLADGHDDEGARTWSAAARRPSSEPDES